MALLIKGMEMPKSCTDCPFKGFDRTGGRGNICIISDSVTFHAVLDGDYVKLVRMGDCPLTPIPPHGRLGDLDEMERKYSQCLVGDAYGLMPTIIPAETSTEET